MIAVDTNILIYAHRRESEWHEAARTCVQGLSQGRLAWGIPWPCLHEFFAIATHPRVFATPTPQLQAFQQIDYWLASPHVRPLAETGRHFETLQQLVIDAKIRGPRVHDARIAAICLQHGVTELWSADRDFRRFPKLKTRNPLIN